MARSNWAAVIDDKTIKAINKKFVEVIAYASENNLPKPRIGDMIDVLISPENLDNLDLKKCMKND